MLGQPPVNAIRLAVRLPDMAAEIGAVDLDVTGQHLALVLGRHCLAQLVREHESGLVLAAQVPAELQRGTALGAVHEIAIAIR